MSPPRICPQPPDCPLYAQRLDYAQDEPLRRAILMERTVPDLGALLRGEALRVCRPQAALPPASQPLPAPILAH